MSAAPKLDRSWDVGELHHTSEGFITTRPRPEDRPEARKILLGHYMDGDPDLLAGGFDQEHREVVDEVSAEYRQHIDRIDRKHRANSIRVQRSILSIQDRLLSHTERTVVFNNVTQGYEVVARSLQGMVFARHPGDVLLTAIEKETLKSHGLGYLSRLLDPPQNLPSDVDALRLKGFNILSPQQQCLCRGLLDVQGSDGQRNFLHHPRPDRDTAMDRVGDLLDDEDQNTLREFLKTDPKRLPSCQERTQVAHPDLFLFAREGEYKNVTAQKVDLENLRAERADTAAYLEALEQKAA
ncbi:hypothetical protein B0H14DRAFT_3662611 [Mycena olivaceomarginata]|nr:hypothetical protein B0H14DRAFT_3662611 [Mycena olivaceomarginata]